MLCVNVVSEDMITKQECKEEMSVDEQEREDNINVLPLNWGVIVFENNVQTNMNLIIHSNNNYYTPIVLEDCFILKTYGNVGKAMTRLTV